jgi:hypothetical protein
MALASFVLSMVALVPILGIISGVLSLIFGFVGRSQIKQSGGLQTGMGLAIAGIVISSLIFVGWFVLLALGLSNH